MGRIRIAAVEYINTLPFLRGLQAEFSDDEIHIYTAHPAACANLYYDGAVDIALVPVGTLGVLPSHDIVTDYCIGCDGPVDTVAVLSHQPLADLSSIALDHHSRTSAKLVQLLCREYYNAPDLSFVPETAPFNADIGRLYIGDKVKEKEGEYRYKYDLGTAWKSWTGLPMVFAVWVASPAVDVAIINRINKTFEHAISQISSLDLSAYQEADFWKHYLLNNIRFEFDDRARAGLIRFLSQCD